MNLHVFHHHTFGPPATPDCFTGLLEQILHNQKLIMALLDPLTAEVANNTTVVNSAIALIQGIKAQLDAAIASNDPAALKALSDQLAANDAALGAAVAANTPAAPATPAPAPAPAA